eukprot:14249294-Alexandrium_andersonii.AAC.1
MTTKTVPARPTRNPAAPEEGTAPEPPITSPVRGASKDATHVRGPGGATFSGEASAPTSLATS